MMGYSAIWWELVVIIAMQQKVEDARGDGGLLKTSLEAEILWLFYK